MSRKRFYQVSAIVAFIIAGLSIIFLIWQHRPNQPVLIGPEQAIQNAIQACNPSYGLKPVEQPTEFQTELTTYEKALGFARMHSKPETPVWVVTMKGRWILVGGPPLEHPGNGEPSYWDECTIIIDGITGESLSSPIE